MGNTTVWDGTPPASLLELSTAFDGLYQTGWPIAGLSLLAAASAPDLKHAFLVHFWVTYLAGFGGGIISAILIGDRELAPIAILKYNSVGLTYAICWWLINYSPFNVVGRLHEFWPVRAVTKASAVFCKATTIVNRVNLAAKLYPGVVAAPLILGTIGGCGGKMSGDVIRNGWGVLDHPSEATVPTFAWWSAFLAAAAHYALAHVSRTLLPAESGALIIAALVAHSLISDVFGWPLDFTRPVAAVAHKISGIPRPATPVPGKSGKHQKSSSELQQLQQTAKDASLATPATSVPAGVKDSKSKAGGGVVFPSTRADARANGSVDKKAIAAAAAKAESKALAVLAQGAAGLGLHTATAAGAKVKAAKLPDDGGGWETQSKKRQ